MSSSPNLNASFVTPAQSCSLIPTHPQEQRLVVTAREDFSRMAPFVRASATARDAEQLLHNGFSPRSDGYYERKACPACTVCMPVRLLLAEFNDSAEHRRVRRRNADMTVTGGRGLPELGNGTYAHNEVVALYHEYMRTRFPEKTKPGELAYDPYIGLSSYGSMAGMSTHHILMRDSSKRLAGGMIYHVGDKEAAYGTVFFYKPTLRKQAPGHFLVLKAIEALQRRKIKYFYLGHWTKQTSAYSWKGNYSPLEVYTNGQWTAPLAHSELRKLRDTAHAAHPKQRRLTPL